MANAEHRQMGDVGAPDPVRPIGPQATPKIRVSLVPLRWLDRVRLPGDRHQAHQPHQPPDALLVHRMAFVLQVQGHLSDPVERRFQELPVDHLHQCQVHLGLALRRAVK
jgi:hypothetical protein